MATFCKNRWLNHAVCEHDVDNVVFVDMLKTAIVDMMSTSTNHINKRLLRCFPPLTGRSAAQKGEEHKGR